MKKWPRADVIALIALIVAIISATTDVFSFGKSILESLENKKDQPQKIATPKRPLGNSDPSIETDPPIDMDLPLCTIVLYGPCRESPESLD